MRPAAHSLSLPPPKKVSKERQPHVSDPALHCAALRYVPGKPASAMTSAARQNSLRAARSVRTTAASQNTMPLHAALQWLRRHHRHRRRCLKGWANRAIAALGLGRASRCSPWHAGRLKRAGLALHGETVGVRGAAQCVPHAAGDECSSVNVCGGRHAACGVQLGSGAVEWVGGAKDGAQKGASSQIPA